MVRRKRRVFAHIGAIVVVILVAMCAMGIAYGAWKDTPYIDGTVITGDWGIQVSTLEANANGSGDTLTIMLDEVPEGIYTTEFTVANTGSIPIKIQDITVSVLPVGEVVIDSIVGVYEGLQLEAVGTPPACMVNYIVTPSDTVVSGSIVITFEAIQWNQYVP